MVLPGLTTCVAHLPCQHPIALTQYYGRKNVDDVEHIVETAYALNNTKRLTQIVPRIIGMMG